MNGEEHGNSHAPAGNEHPIPVGEAAPAPLPAPAVNPPAQAVIQQNVGSALQGNQGCTKIENCNGPFSVKVIEEDALSSFERITVRYGYWGIVFAFVSLVIASYGAFCVYQQFKEMAAQTELLSRGAKQARIDSATASVATAEQLRVLQGQTKVAENQVAVLGKAFESIERPYIGVATVDNSNDKNTKRMTITVYFKNFGATPAERVFIERFWYSNGQELIKHTPTHGNGGTIYPGVTRTVIDTIDNVDFPNIKDGTLWVRYYATYEWKNKHYDYCEEFTYAPMPTEAFIERGSCRPVKLTKPASSAN